jgi:hypothetical protein
LDTEESSSKIPLQTRMAELLKTGNLNTKEIAQKLGVLQSTIRARLSENKHKFQHLDDGKWVLSRENCGTTVTSDYQLPPDSTWEEHLEAIKATNKIVSFHNQVPETINIRYDTKLPIGLVFSSDWQLGQFGVDYHAFQEDMNTIATEPGLYIDIGGDLRQNIIQSSKIGSSHNQAPISVQNGLVVLTLKKLIDRINSVRTGNHDYWSASLTGEDWLGETLKHLKLRYAKHGTRINLQVGNQIYPYMARHVGKYNSSFNLTHMNKQEQRINYPWARFTVFEHQHLASMEQYRYAGQECVAIRTGTYAVYDDFAEQWGFYGAHVCNPTVVLFPNEDRIVGFKDMHDAIIFLRAVRGDK